MAGAKHTHETKSLPDKIIKPVVDVNADGDQQEITEPEEQPQTEKKKLTGSRILANGAAVGSKTLSVKLSELSVADGAWIDAGNLEDISQTGFGLGNGAKKEFSPKRAVACTTTDFAMQNIIIQLGLKLVTVNGMAIKRVKQWVLKCDGCFFITPQMDKKFCPRCGGATMARLSVTVGKNRKFKYGYNPNRRINLRRHEVFYSEEQRWTSRPRATFA